MSQKQKTHIIIGRFLKLLRPFWGKGAIVSLGMIFNVLLDIPMPLLTMFLIDDVLVNKNIAPLYYVSLVLILLIVLQTFVSYVVSYGLGDLKQSVFLHVKSQLLARVQGLSMSFFHRHNPGYIVSRISDDVEASESLLFNTFTQIFLNILKIVIGMIMLIRLNLILSFVSFAVLPFFILSLNTYNEKTRKLSEETAENTAQNKGILQEIIIAVRLIKSFVREKEQLLIYERSYQKAIGKRLQLLRVGLRSSFTTNFLASVGPIIVLVFGGYQIINGDFTIGQLVAFNAFLAYIYTPIRVLMNINMRIQGSMGPVRRVFQIFDMPAEVLDKKSACPKFERGEIEFKNVTFGYDPQKPVLKNINLHIPPKSSLAVIGPSGSGKTTLVEMISRFYDPQKGRIMIDGANIKTLSLRCVREQVSEVTQHSYMFKGTIKDNIKFGKLDATDQEVIKAARISYAHNFIGRMKKKYDTKIGDKGLALSGGEQQRIALARAVIKNHPILILDEATSALDVESEFYIQRALKEIMKNTTTIIIAHRLSTIHNVDKIIVLEKGRIIQQGNHKQLYSQKSGLYRKLHDILETENKEQEIKVV